MLDPENQVAISQEIQACLAQDTPLLQQLRQEVRPLKHVRHKIQERTTTAVSLVATDGGNNQIEFDPFLVQLIRVVDSSNNEYFLQAVTPNTDRRWLGNRQFDESGEPRTCLGKMMQLLGVTDLWSLSAQIAPPDSYNPISPSWVLTYRELVEWAVLLSLVGEHEFGTDVLIVFDGLLRSKVFAHDLFAKYRGLLDLAIARQRERHHKVYIVGLAKHSKVLQRYQLALHVEEVFATDYPCYVQVPQEMEEASYTWKEYARRDVTEGSEANKFVAGSMFLVKFGSRSMDPVWPVDLLMSQTAEAPVVLGYLTADARAGFPVPFYPRCLQKAHENAEIVDFDLAIMQDEVVKGIRAILGSDAAALDSFALRNADPAKARYQ